MTLLKRDLRRGRLDELRGWGCSRHSSLRHHHQRSQSMGSVLVSWPYKFLCGPVFVWVALTRLLSGCRCRCTFTKPRGSARTQLLLLFASPAECIFLNRCLQSFSPVAPHPHAPWAQPCEGRTKASSRRIVLVVRWTDTLLGRDVVVKIYGICT